MLQLFSGFREYLDMIGEAGPVVVFEDRVGSNEGLDDYVTDVSLELVNIYSLLSHLSVQSTQSPLAPVLLVPNELFTALVDSIVGQVHEQLVLNIKHLVKRNQYQNT